MKNFQDRVVSITGGASGIGRATALEFARSGAHLVIADINEPGALQAAEEIRALGRRALTVRRNQAVLVFTFYAVAAYYLRRLSPA